MNACRICDAGTHPGDPTVRQYTWKGKKYWLCDDCVSENICPMCLGRGAVTVKRGRSPARVETCDLCAGSGIVLHSEHDLEITKMVKVPTWAYDNLKRAKVLLERKKSQIPSDMGCPTLCPACGKSMHSLKVKYEYSSCPNCGYTQHSIDFSTVGTFTLGAIVGLGIAYLMKELGSRD